MDPQRLQFLFDKYLKKQCTRPELEELIALLQEADAGELLTPSMQSLWDQLKEDKTDYPVDWDRMYETISKSEEQLAVFNQPVHRNSRTLKYAMAAAIIILCAGTAAYWYASGRYNRKNEQAQAAAPVQSPVYKIQTIHLPDGSTVILKADSKLHYPAAFTGTTRDVYLEGEGYFDIRHKARQPFLVHTGKITTRVLGTAFDIKAYPSDEAVEITVTRGRVQVMQNNKSLGLLTANQQISFNKTSDAFQLKKVDVQPIVAWKPAEILFDDITMQEAMKKIEQKFNVVIEFANPAIKDCRVTATFSEGDMLNEMLTVICGVIKADYTILNNKIIIDGKACN